MLMCMAQLTKTARVEAPNLQQGSFRQRPHSDRTVEAAGAQLLSSALHEATFPLRLACDRLAHSLCPTPPPHPPLLLSSLASCPSSAHLTTRPQPQPHLIVVGLHPSSSLPCPQVLRTRISTLRVPAYSTFWPWRPVLHNPPRLHRAIFTTSVLCALCLFA